MRAHIGMSDVVLVPVLGTSASPLGCFAQQLSTAWELARWSLSLAFVKGSSAQQGTRLTLRLSSPLTSSALQIFQKELHPSVYKAGKGAKEGLSLFGMSVHFTAVAYIGVYQGSLKLMVIDVTHTGIVNKTKSLLGSRLLK